MENITIGMVLFNPDNVERLYSAINSALNQVEKIYIFDNSTEIKKYKFSDSVIYISEHKNKGIAYAINQIMKKAQLDGYEWVVTMDQDSVLPDNIINAYSKHLNEVPNLAIICPQVIDYRRSYMKIKEEAAAEYVDFCITSASCTRISAWERIGGYDDWLFIDLVDNDFCKRITASGYRILRLNDFVLDQEFGKIVPKSERVQKFWNAVAEVLHNDNWGKFGYSKFVNPTRVYYTCRNVIYVNRKLKNYGKTGYRDNYNCNGFLGFLICFVIPSILGGKDKFEIMKCAFCGFRDGRKRAVVLWSTSNGK